MRSSVPLFALCCCFAIMDTRGDTLPTLPEAFGRGIPGAGAVAQGTGLSRITVPAARYPDAHCADGTPAVTYVRRAADEIHRDDWIVYLQGGGSCDSGQDCHERWLGRDGNFGANKLSSRFAPSGGIVAEGIQSRDARNPFAAWNHVFVYYCSSDGWAGTAQGVATEATHEGAPVAYRVDFLGAGIIDAVFDMLRSGSLSYANAAGHRITLPDLDSARRVLFAGSSAGGSGVRTHADRIGALLRANNVRCTRTACGLTYGAVLDGSYGLGVEELDHTHSSACGSDLAGSCTYETSMRRRWFDILLGFRDGMSDASCLSYHSPRGDEWRCVDGVHVLQHHVQTPFFVRNDLQDRLVMGNTLGIGYAYEGIPLDRSLYGGLQEIQLRELATLATRSEEPRMPSALAPPGVFGPQCGDHETLRSNEPTFQRAIITDDGARYTGLQVLANWLTGRSPAAVIEDFESGQLQPGCR